MIIATSGYLSGFDLEGLDADRIAPDELATRSRLLIAAVHQFADRGYEASSMRELAAEVGVKAPAIYNHFSSKTEVLAAAVDHVLSDFLATVLPGLEDFPPQDRLFELLRRHVLYKTDNVAAARANDKLLDADFMTRVMPAAQRDRITAALGGYRTIVRDMIVEAAPGAATDAEVDLPVLTSAIIEMCDRVSAWFRPDGSLTGEAVAEQCCVIARRMVSW